MESPNYRAVLIGIDDYSHKPLRGCVNDIDQIERILRDRLKVPSERITRFAAPSPGAGPRKHSPSLKPTCDEIRKFLNRLAGEVEPDDLVFLYYSGHGSQVMTKLNRRWIAREALVPMDYWNGDEPQRHRLLYDFELNDLLARIAKRAGDLTVVLDCCHSASATRGEEQDRFMEIREVQDLSSQAPPGGEEASTRDASSLVPAAAVHMLVAACKASERAYEVEPDDSKPQQGAFSRALVQILEATKKPLADLRWWDIWSLLVDRVSSFNSLQHPELGGRGERRLFGGPWARRDLGYLVSKDGKRFQIAAGTLTGLSEGAEVAVYGAAPDLFPALGSKADHEARIGLLRVEQAERSSCTAVPVNGNLKLPPEARGRLVKPGEADRLTISLEPSDPGLAARLRACDIDILPPGSSEAEAHIRREGKLLHLGDEIYGDGRDPLVSFPAAEPGLAEAVLGHYARYRQVLRLHQRCVGDLTGALKIKLLDCRNMPKLALKSSQSPRLPQFPIDPKWGYKIREGEAFAIRIDNQTEDDNLHVFVLNCAGSGRVEYLGHAEIPARSIHVLWCDQILGNPFYPAVGAADRKEIFDRLVAVGTTLPDQDLSYLKIDEPFAKVIQRHRDRDRGQEAKDTLAHSEQAPIEKWTAEMVTLRIYK
jgi:Caspase domain